MCWGDMAWESQFSLPHRSADLPWKALLLCWCSLAICKIQIVSPIACFLLAPAFLWFTWALLSLSGTGTDTKKSEFLFFTHFTGFLPDWGKSLFGKNYRQYLSCFRLTPFVLYWFFRVRRKDHLHLKNFWYPVTFRLQPVVALMSRFIVFSMPLCFLFYYRNKNTHLMDLLWRLSGGRPELQLRDRALPSMPKVPSLVPGKKK